MKITVLGSAAAEAVPALWCGCDYCRQAATRGGKDLRRRSCYLVDQDTLVDFGPDAASQCRDAGLDWQKLDRIFFSHPHSDHCNPVELMWRQPNFAHQVRPLEVVGTDAVRHYLNGLLTHYQKPETVDVAEFLRLAFRTVEPNVPTRAGDWDVLPLRAAHCPGAVNYLLRRNGHAVLFANDTGSWDEETWQTAAGANADLAIIDSTMGLVFADWDKGHMGVEAVVRFRDRLLRDGILKPGGIAAANHFSHKGNSLQSDLEAFFTPHGIAVCFDGMTIEL